MDYEKKYKEALEQAKKELAQSGSDSDSARQIKRFFPELAESEDERIRKELKEAFEAYDIESKWNGIPIRSIFAWLEKQKEQKPAEWKPQPESLEALMYAIEGKWEAISPTSYLSRRLEDLYEGLVNTFNVDESLLAELPKVASRAYTAEDIEELRALKDKIEASMESPENKPAEWSEEDKKMMDSIINELGQHYKTCTSRDCPSASFSFKAYQKEIDWLKSLRPHWKPSEGQMEALLWCTAHLGGADHRVLAELYEHLKKL